MVDVVVDDAEEAEVDGEGDEGEEPGDEGDEGAGELGESSVSMFRSDRSGSCRGLTEPKVPAPSDTRNAMKASPHSIGCNTITLVKPSEVPRAISLT